MTDLNVESPRSFLKNCKNSKETLPGFDAVNGLCFVFEDAVPSEVNNVVSRHVSAHPRAKNLEPVVTEIDGTKAFSSGNLGKVFVASLNRIGRPGGEGPRSHDGQLEESVYAFYRERAGKIFSVLPADSSVQFIFNHMSREALLGFLTGLEIAHYHFLNEFKKVETNRFASVEFFHQDPNFDDILAEAERRGAAVNLARHLVNLPPNVLHPESYGDFIRQLFLPCPTVALEIWSGEKLVHERLGLLRAVGQATSQRGPRLIKLSYRPTGKPANAAPIVLVGKGITFDSGGLDIKPSSGMRLMKKDMGGSASVLGVFWWAVHSNYADALDAYLPVAENAVGEKSFHPGDVIEARNGLLVEIHNTDAEGRLVLADAFDVAVETPPRFLIDVATLTGAMRVGLGTEIAGLFSNSDELARDLQSSGQRAGDLNWRMPLYFPYANNFSSPFADLVNAVDGMGGAITAALFLERFVKNVPWAHLDAYCWSDKATGSLRSPGGSGQTVQCLIEFLKQVVEKG